MLNKTLILEIHIFFMLHLHYGLISSYTGRLPVPFNRM